MEKYHLHSLSAPSLFLLYFLSPQKYFAQSFKLSWYVNAWFKVQVIWNENYSKNCLFDLYVECRKCRKEYDSPSAFGMRFAYSADWSVSWISFSALSNVFLDLSLLIWNYFSHGSGSCSFTFSVCATRHFIPTPLPSPFFIFNWPVLFVAFFFSPPPSGFGRENMDCWLQEVHEREPCSSCKKSLGSVWTSQRSIGVFSRSSIPSWREKYTSSKYFNFLIC